MRKWPKYASIDVVLVVLTVAVIGLYVASKDGSAAGILVGLAGGVAGIALGLLIVWAVLSWLTKTPNAANKRTP